jgi:hypothetical protein
MRLRRRWLTFVPAALLAAALLPAAASCQAVTQAPAADSVSTSSSAHASPAATCGTPPCDKYLSRSETRDLDHAVTDHPTVSAIAMHIVVSALCGGILCVWGEGFTFAYVQRETHIAAQNNECLRVHVLPQGRQWQLVSLDGSNQSPYCTG